MGTTPGAYPHATTVDYMSGLPLALGHRLCTCPQASLPSPCISSPIHGPAAGLQGGHQTSTLTITGG